MARLLEVPPYPDSENLHVLQGHSAYHRTLTIE